MTFPVQRDELKCQGANQFRIHFCKEIAAVGQVLGLLSLFEIKPRRPDSQSKSPSKSRSFPCVIPRSSCLQCLGSDPDGCGKQVPFFLNCSVCVFIC